MPSNTDLPGVMPLGRLFYESSKRFAHRVALIYPEGNGFTSCTYAEYRDRVRGFAAVLHDMGLQPGDKVVAMSENCWEWSALEWACQTLGLVLVPIYPTLPSDQAQYIVRDCQAKVGFAGDSELLGRIQGVEGFTATLLRDGENSIAAKARSSTLDEAIWLERMNSIDPMALATLIYTSGTTGNPKGVMLPHRAPTWICHQVRASLPVSETDIFFNFLPLSHIFSRVVNHWLPVSIGAGVAFGKGVATLANDIAATQPTVVACVPRLLEAIRERIVDNARKEKGLKEKLFNLALDQGRRRFNGQFAPLSGPLGAIVGKRIRARFGGNIRFFVSGGAPLPLAVAEFYDAVGMRIRQGYGLTETTAATCLNVEPDYRPWTVGPAIHGVEIRLAEDGEILVRGPSVMDGYYNLPEDTAAAIDSEGWFHTGDIGVLENGQYKITDRKKDILVLSNGKNVAPLPIEAKLKEIRYIQEAVCFGDQSDYVYALIVPNFDRIERDLKELGFKPPASRDEWVSIPEVRMLVKKEIDALNKTLADFEKVKKYVFTANAFSIEGGELTPKMSVKRKFVKEKYATLLAEIER